MAARAPEAARAPGAPFRVALTFDAEHPDRPTDPGAEARLLDTLDRLDVRASFFLQGRWVEAYPDRARSVAQAEHVIGSHGFYHVRMPLLSAEGLRTDIADAERVIVDATGIDPRPWFRCAFGAGENDPRVLAAVAAAGYRHVPWDVEAEDWEPARSGDAIAATCIDGLALRRSAGTADETVVLLHTWPAGTANGLAGLVTRLRDLGAVLVGIDELERFRAPVSPTPR